ncbi:hypothetical protein DFA_06189 [Cavenderia fasciculata]|uniref:Uncharacterized protein n=1 Tax=Cavenderia fasciculata TaxID=261658 RepID=F4PKC7_CACFS|nr:uncharacterized protein DFA_06189 [Cavenderia fasciculata]EGG24051.1 hypothetical protein DFA_06189 [Cavenderia fasciculata]|eukprot:XP_004361902.1 hypothetical protein DFA_06189 [Cavenderia fasciculata]
MILSKKLIKKSKHLEYSYFRIGEIRLAASIYVYYTSVASISLENLSKLSPISNHGANQNVTVQSYSDVSSDSVNSIACRRRRGCCGRGNNIDTDIDIDICIDNAFGGGRGARNGWW